MTIWRAAAMSTVGMALAALALGAGSVPAFGADKDPLDAINTSFRRAYAEARLRTLRAAEPVIVVRFDSVILYRDGTSQEWTFTPKLYHETKSVSHLTLGIFVALAGKTGRPLDARTVTRLQRFRALVRPARASLQARGWPPSAVLTHAHILTGSERFIDDTLSRGAVSDDDLAAFARRMQPLVSESGRIAAEAQLDGLHRRMTTIRGELGDAGWRKLKVVVLGPRQARAGNLQYSYFARTMGKEAEGTRLFYAEGIFDPKGGRRLLGTILLDRKASVAYFGDPRRLERDFLSDAAAAHIARLFGDKR